MPLDEVYHRFIEVYCVVKRVTMRLVHWFIVRLIVGFNRAVTRTVFVHVSSLLYNLEGQRVVCREFKERFTGLDNGVVYREAYKAVFLPFTLLFIIIVIIILFVTFAVTIAVGVVIAMYGTHIDFTRETHEGFPRKHVSPSGSTRSKERIMSLPLLLGEDVCGLARSFIAV